MIYDWSPSGALRALELLMKARGMLSDRARVEHSGSIVRYEIVGVDIDESV